MCTILVHNKGPNWFRLIVKPHVGDYEDRGFDSHWLHVTTKFMQGRMEFELQSYSLLRHQYIYILIMVYEAKWIGAEL